MNQREATAETMANGGTNLLPRFDAGTLQAAFGPAEFWLEWQAAMLKAAASAAAGWIARRREDTEAALRTLEQLANCRDLESMTGIYRRWADDESKRLKSDIDALTIEVLLWSQGGAVVTDHHAAAPDDKAAACVMLYTSAS